MASLGADSRLAGRGVEQQLLVRALEGTASGRPCAVVVHGEAGVGKTRLLREICDGLDADFQVLWGTCVHFGEASVPFAPVSGALQSWLERADAPARVEVFSGAGELGILLPAMGDARMGEPGRLLPQINLVFNRLVGRGPAVLVIDDLQWADRSSLDVLAYLIAGFRGQRMALLATCRDEHRGEGHPLHGWLADMRRMPGFTEIHLDRLDLAATEAQIRGLVGNVVDVGFAAQVHERSDGNPYLTELLVRGLSGTETALPTAAPEDLKDALLATWHGLSAAARQVARVLAVGGHPIEVMRLADVVGEHGVVPTMLTGCLTEARDHGVVAPDDMGRLWFRHPLLADVLYDGMPPGEAVNIHATYVRVLEPVVGGTRPAGLADDLAVHNHRAGRVNDAYRWSLIAASHAAELHAAAEEAIHLDRACSLWEQVSPGVRGSPTGYLELLRRAGDVCGRVGRLDSAVSFAERALKLVDRNSDPLLKSVLLQACWRAKYLRSVPGKMVGDELIEAVRLTDQFPDSPERALALQELASAERADGSFGRAAAHSAQAVLAAQRSGSELALAAALSARALVHRFESDLNSLDDAEEAERLARSCGSTDWLASAAIAKVRCLLALGKNVEATAAARAMFEEVLAAGSERAYHLAAYAADGLLWSGHWSECRDVLRAALAARCGGVTGASVRLRAAQLAARCGRTREAKQHLNRATELVSAQFARSHPHLTIAAAEVFLASGEPHEALHWLYSRILPEDAAYNEDFIADFAHAAAESALTARDAGDGDGAAQAVATLEDLIARWPHEPFRRRVDLIALAGKALFNAEVARCRNDAGQAELWRRAIADCHTVGWPWLEARSRLRCAEAMLAAGSAVAAVSELLQQAYLTFLELGAQPLLEETESLARITRVNLNAPVPLAATPRTPSGFAGLTTREREILSFLVAGRSNGEIAKQLVISDKTVSVHVSNILRKTGTTTRVEAAALAERAALNERLAIQRDK
ncbi:helix-turn-helix transcriptional regulator [Kribbella pratensis]|uniref:Regulatory LuxR family protein n=1 Tax=Kribbella pratensis TaxID=2512112 RepID=A0A4R8CF79_9ACTN|nr:LuxR family transcriptional regulator [Kribbella pratensis]TDW74949.1 regulatory LuxR family protein [Kribbella pratensis]